MQLVLCLKDVHLEVMINAITSLSKESKFSWKIKKENQRFMYKNYSVDIYDIPSTAIKETQNPHTLVAILPFLSQFCKDQGNIIPVLVTFLLLVRYLYLSI